MWRSSIDVPSGGDRLIAGELRRFVVGRVTSRLGEGVFWETWEGVVS